TCGRAARNSEGRVIMYADRRTQSIEKCIEVTVNRRKIQEAHNSEHGITPKTVMKGVSEDLAEAFPVFKAAEKEGGDAQPTLLDPKEIKERIEECEKEMKLAAKELRFEEAARFRDLLKYYQDLQLLEDHPV
ncbi:MAG: UvrB/UvrC motif-containing protein, partial [Chlamydiia bacterium]|nr:UvrB/UvrC motif-containing protein [Chlamydiia bacterium]